MTREKRTERQDLERQYFEPHASYLDEARQGFEEKLAADSEQQSADEEHDLAVEVLQLATFLEAQARTLLVDSLHRASTERLLLQADANVQTRLLDELGALDGIPWREQLREMRQNESETSSLDRVREYRRTYARLLVTGARLLRLGGRDLEVFVRRRSDA